MRSLVLGILLGSLLLALPLSAQDDGARLYMLAPKDLTIASVRVHSLNSNVGADTGTISDDPDLETALVVFQFVQELEVANQQHFAFLVVPGSRIHSDVGLTPGGSADSITGLGDIQLGYVVGLHGTPSLPATDYAAHEPGLAVNLLGKLFLPTGRYSEARTTNIGANRFAVRLGMPIVYAIGEGMGDPSLTTIEVMPTVTFYGENEDPYGAGRMTQDPLLLVEGHLTRGFTRNFWASIDMLWRRGGETEFDGVPSDNSQSALSLGVTGTFAVAKAISLRLSGGAVVDRNAHGPNGWMARAILGTVF